MNNKVITSVVFPKELWEEMKLRSFQEKISLGELVRKAVGEYLKKKPKKKGGK